MTDTTDPDTASRSDHVVGERPPIATRTELFRLFLAEQHDPEPFYERLADRTLAKFDLPIAGRRVLDLGSGPGHYTAALERAGAVVAAADLSGDDIGEAVGKGLAGVVTDAARLPFPDGTFDGVFSSNLMEHVPDVGPVLDEIERVLRVGGWAWVSWTNWYSPWGGHFITPFHYLGPDLGYKVHVRLRGEPPHNRVYDGLWPTYIGATMREVEARPGLTIRSAVPRYYPSQRWIMRVPGLREVASWNCLLELERVAV
jgi:SAM-dependent methyltransferase